MTRRADPLVLDRRLEPADLRWLVASEAAMRAYRAMYRPPTLRERSKGWLDVGLVVLVIVLVVAWGRVQGA